MSTNVILIVVLFTLCGNSDAHCDGQCGEGEGNCNDNNDCLTGFRCKRNKNYFGWGKNYCTQEKCQEEPSCCSGQCGEGEGNCNSNEDCLPGFECKENGWKNFFSKRSYCTEEFRYWKCDQFPQWLQKTYRIRGVNFCKEQWNAKFLRNHRLFNSQPKCNDKVLPTISFYDTSMNKSLCTINMNDMKKENDINVHCGEMLAQLRINQEVWIVYLVHGFTDFKSGWYPQFRDAIGKAYAKNYRTIIVGEVVWKDGSAAMLETAFSRKLSSSSFQETQDMYAEENRAGLGHLYDVFTCSSWGIGSIDWSGWATVASNTMVVGHALGKLTESLYGSITNGNLKTFCIGHSAGAHVCGFSGKTRIFDGIIGLDPAGPIFQDNYRDGRLSDEDAKFVQVLHFDGGELGIDQPLGHQDIFVNGGRGQPGCHGILSELFCSHVVFAINFQLKLFLQESKNDACYAIKKCRNENDAMNDNLDECIQVHGVQAKVGAFIDQIPENSSGIFYLDTKNVDEQSCYLTQTSLGKDAFGVTDIFKNGINAFLPREMRNY